MSDYQADHHSKREHTPGRWLPVFLYSVNYLVWIVITMKSRAGDLLWLAALPSAALILYLVRTGGQKNGA